MEFHLDDPEKAPPYKSVYKLLTGSIVPRPIGWVSTVDGEGNRNLAPFSYFNAIGANPPHVLFCPGIRGTDRSVKDTMHNIRATSEFVVNIVTEELAEAMNITATEFPAEIDEFEAAGVTPQRGMKVSAYRVAESPVNYECEVSHVIETGDPADPGAGTVVIGRVLHLHVRDDILFDGDKIDIEKLKPVGRLAGGNYCRVTDIFHLQRPPSQVTPKEG